MNCPKCNRELRVIADQVGVDEGGLPLFHRFAVCDFCLTRKDLDIEEPDALDICPVCKGKMRIDTEQVGQDEDGLPLFHRFAYCDKCMRKKDLDLELAQNTETPVAESPVVMQEPPLTAQNSNDTQGLKEYVNNRIEILDPQEGIQVQLAREELRNEAKVESKSDRTLSVMFFVIMLALILWPNKSATMILWDFTLVPLSFILWLVFAGKAANKDQHKKQLQHIASGRKIVNVCPKCKSPDVEMDMVQSGGFTSHGTSRMGKNINPLHPLTHTNIRRGMDYTSFSYRNQCHCKNCGHVFSRPEVYYL